MLELVWSIFLYMPCEKSFIWSWSWFEAFCFTNPLRKSSFETGSVWSILIARSFKKASFEAEAGLKHLALQILQERLHLRLDLVWSFFPLQILEETLHLRRELVWSILLNNSLKNVFIWGWIWFEASCFTDPLREASFEAEAGLKHFASQILQERLHLRLKLVWSILLYKSFKTG